MSDVGLSAMSVSEETLVGLNERAVSHARLVALDRFWASEQKRRSLSPRALAQMTATRRKLLKATSANSVGERHDATANVRFSQEASSVLMREPELPTPALIGGLIPNLGLGYEGRVRLPRAADGFSVAPAVTGASGSIETTQLNEWAGIRYTASIQDDAGTPAGSVWQRNWRQLALFPPPASNSFVGYQLDVDFDTLVIRDWGIDYGVVMIFVSVGHAPFYDPAKPIPVDRNAGWPVLLEVHDITGLVLKRERHLRVTGQMRVPALTVSAIALIHDLLIVLRDGQIYVDGSIAPRASLRPTYTLTDEELLDSYGKIAYRITPELISSSG